jgi:hypothetical protein
MEDPARRLATASPGPMAGRFPLRVRARLPRPNVRRAESPITSPNMPSHRVIGTPAVRHPQIDGASAWMGRV